MNETRLFADMFGKACQERDDIMLCLALDLVYSVDVEAAALPDRLCGPSGNHAKLSHGVTGVRLNFIPDLKLALFGPD